MEYAKYGTLIDFLSTDSSQCKSKIMMKEQTTKSLVKDVSLCLNYINAIGFFYYDFKPQNILVFWNYTEGRIKFKISDIGNY